ncbi:S-adenosyl-L-methionine-dependent methyltransferase [Gongronella butleri]|nr:S-adenosyl-L-methionine-dependent methyltransferase [Gongronella butleri]
MVSTQQPHETAVSGFDKQTDNYDLARPSYPASAIEKIQSLLPAHAKVAEIGSGTGIMTRLLVAAGFDITAIEPVDGMRKKFSESLPDVPVIKATAWDTTLPDASQDAVIIAQAFHWFDDLNTLKEANRILKPNGKLMLIWNMESKSAKWVDQLRALYESYDSAAPQYRKNQWQKVFEEPASASLFQLPLQHAHFDYNMPSARELIMPRILSKSYIAVMDEEEQARLAARVNAVLDDPAYEFACDENGKFVYPHDTDLYWAEKI